MSTPTGFYRREMYVDARDLQSDSDPDNPLTPEEYSAVLTNRGLEKLSNHLLVQSFDADVRTHNPTYTYNEDYKLGDMITVIDERLAITVDAVVRGIQRSKSGGIETLSITIGNEQPTIGKLLSRKEDK